MNAAELGKQPVKAMVISWALDEQERTLIAREVTAGLTKREAIALQVAGNLAASGSSSAAHEIASMAVAITDALLIELAK
jgi:hypothetical protein